MQIVKPLIAVVTAVEVNFVAVDSSGVVVTASWLWTKSLRFTPTNQIVKVKHVKVVESLFAVPTSENIKEVPNFVARVSGPATGWVVLGKWSIPSHFQIK